MLLHMVSYISTMHRIENGKLRLWLCDGVGAYKAVAMHPNAVSTIATLKCIETKQPGDIESAIKNIAETHAIIHSTIVKSIFTCIRVSFLEDSAFKWLVFTLGISASAIRFGAAVKPE
jgi:hypothetical protein